MVFMTSRQRRCTSRTIGLHAVNFKRLHARRHAGWAARQRPCGTVLSFAIMLQWAAVGKVAVNWIQLCCQFASSDFRIFHLSCEMKISLRESSRRNLARIVRYSRM